MDLGVGNAIGAGIGGLLNMANTALQINASQQLAKQNRIWQHNQWLEENEYNSPASQMQRYKDAGLNPNLLYGNIQPGNAQPLRMNDPFNSKEVTEALRSLDFQQMAVGIAKAKEELKALKLQNKETSQNIKLKEKNTELASYNAHLKGMEAEAAYMWGMDHQYYIDEDSHYISSPSNLAYRADYKNLPYYFLDRWNKELDRLETGTEDIQTKKELNELKKTTQEYINQWKSTELNWEPWMFGIDAFSKILGAIFGGVRSLYKPH